MTAVRVPAPQFGQAAVDPSGVDTPGRKTFLQQVYNRLGGAVDKVDQALQAGLGSAPAARKILAGAGLSGGGDLTADFAIRLYVATTSVAALPTTDIQPNAQAFALNGRKPGESGGAGTGCPVIWTNGAWYSLFSGAVVTA